ncbi:MAG: OB-fold domain-containing protein [Pseudomonadales bacterium]|nr:OB-fold domain-containing protein [Pseudomonadales bacterium]
MSQISAAELLEKVKPLLNRRVGPYKSFNPVSRTQVWQWCTAMGDDNPLYLAGDEVIAPPTMMQMWTMRNAQGNYPEGSSDANPYEILRIMEDHGYAGVMAVSYDQTFHRYLTEGDQVHHYSTIVNITDEKSTGIGKGFFVTELAQFLDQNEECFAEATITYFQYQAPKRPASQKSSSGPMKINRVAPIENHDNEHYWEGLRQGKLLIQKCTSCDTLRHPPQPMCECCQSTEWDTVAAKGKGTVYTYTIMHYPEIPPFDYPNAIVLVDLEEGVRLVSQLTDCKPDDIAIGMPVEMEIKEVQEGMSLPLFKAAK